MENPVEALCPWCGEFFTTFFDVSQGACSYIEDCQVCCRPIMLTFDIMGDGSVALATQRD